LPAEGDFEPGDVKTRRLRTATFSIFDHTHEQMKNFKVWSIVAIAFQFLTGLIHAMSFFFQSPPANETERKVVEVFTTYKLDMGAGYHRTTEELFLSVSACFTLLFLFGGMTNTFLLRKHVSADVMKGMLVIQLFTFGACFGAMLTFAFLPPIVLSGLTFTALLIARFSITGNPT
jgi:hypothetical protein